MALRIALLALFTGLFIVVWSGDQPGYVATKCPSSAPKRSDKASPSEPSRETARRAANGLWNGVIPIPKRIPGGTYLVTDRFGHTEVCFVARPDKRPSFAADQSSIVHFVVDEGENRWHFIRIESPLIVSKL